MRITQQTAEHCTGFRVSLPGRVKALVSGVATACYVRSSNLRSFHYNYNSAVSMYNIYIPNERNNTSDEDEDVEAS